MFAQVNGFNTFHHKTETLFKLTTMNTCLEPVLNAGYRIEYDSSTTRSTSFAPRSVFRDIIRSRSRRSRRHRPLRPLAPPLQAMLQSLQVVERVSLWIHGRGCGDGGISSLSSGNSRGEVPVPESHS